MLSIILLSYYSGGRIVKVYSDLQQILGLNEIKFELIIIDDGSKDNSFEVASELERTSSNVRAFQLSKNYSSFYAIFAGLSVCQGNCAIAIPDDEQLPYEAIVKMYRKWQKGEKIIIPHRIKRADGHFNNMCANLFYRLINSVSEVKYPSGGADTFFIDREIIDIVNSKIHPVHTSIVAEVLRLGFSPCFHSYERGIGINPKSRWSQKKKFKLFKDIFFSSSTLPIKLITLIGLFFIFASLILVILYGYVLIFGEADRRKIELPTWASTMVIVSFFSGIIVFSLGIIAEYIWRIYEEVKNRPGYIIRKKQYEE